MDFPEQYICAGYEMNSYRKFVPAPYFRKAFFTDTADCRIRVTGLGFYRFWINGTELTKGLCAPYISNPDDIVYFDEYDLSPYIRLNEKNVLGFQLGNGMQNAPGGSIWDFDRAKFRAAPKLAFLMRQGERVRVFSGRSVKTAPSPLYFDDLRAGVRYDARKEIPGWNLPDFDDSGWADAVLCESPRGEARICEAEPILPAYELKPVSVRKGSLLPYRPRGDVPKVEVPEDASDGREGWIYDFGKNNAGIVRLKICGRPGQRVVLQFAELCKGDALDYNNINFYPDGFSQRDVFVCKGGEEVFEPPFTYHGFRYCLVMGIDEAQATPELLTYLVCSSALGTVGRFACSDGTANRLYEMCDASDRSNFYYFPTDCPHREKNGWTGDAALSAEHMLMTLGAGASFKEWLRNIRKAQRETGELPGIVPTGGWGFAWGNGPVWDSALIRLPYYTYKYTGDRAILAENAAAILRYLHYASEKRKASGLVEYGLGDWCAVGGMKSTTEYTDSVTIMDCAGKAAEMFGVLGQKKEKTYAETLFAEMRAAIRLHLIDKNRCVADTGCQTSQAMALYYGVFDEDEREKATAYLIDAIHKNDDFIEFGIIGARVLFHVLSDAGEGELAYKMITRPEFPSYGALIGFGETTVPESFDLPGEGGGSHDHHMYCDIKNWFISRVAGLRYNPDGDDCRRVLVKPSYISSLRFAEAEYLSPYGKIAVRWERADGGIRLTLDAPEEIAYEIVLPDGTVRTGCGKF